MFKQDLKTSLSAKIASLLRIKIIKGEFADGEHLNEVRIAGEYNVSRGPIREALNILENEGFAHTPSNGRTVAVAFTQKDFIDYHDIRFFLESEAIKRVIKDSNSKNGSSYDSWINDLEKHVRVMEQSTDAASEGTFNTCDFLFHKQIMLRSRNRMAMKVWDSLSGIRHGIMVVNKHYLASKEVLGSIYGSHTGIFEGLKERNVEKAVHSCRVHMDHSIELYADAY